jgi:hypothetical protein
MPSVETTKTQSKRKWELLYLQKKKMVTCKLLQDSYVKLFVARTKKLSEQKKEQKHKKEKHKKRKKEKVTKLSKAVSFRHLAWLFEFPFKKKEFKEIQQTSFFLSFLSFSATFFLVWWNYFLVK